MQAAGGIDWLVGIAGSIIRRNPSRITYVAPIVTFVFTMGAGTGNIYFSLIPVINATSYEAKDPARAAAVGLDDRVRRSGLTARPVAAAMAAMLALVTATDENFTLSNILMITIPAGLAGTIVTSFVDERIGGRTWPTTRSISAGSPRARSSPPDPARGQASCRPAPSSARSSSSPAWRSSFLGLFRSCDPT